MRRKLYDCLGTSGPFRDPFVHDAYHGGHGIIGTYMCESMNVIGGGVVVGEWNFGFGIVLVIVTYWRSMVESAQGDSRNLADKLNKRMTIDSFVDPSMIYAWQ